VLRDLGYDNVSVKVGDGYHGWPERAPFDSIIVTAALGHVPPALIEQLKVGGRLVMPLGPALAPQQLTVVEKIAPSETWMRSITLVRFVPFTDRGLNVDNTAMVKDLEAHVRAMQGSCRPWMDRLPVPWSARW